MRSKKGDSEALNQKVDGKNAMETQFAQTLEARNQRLKNLGTEVLKENFPFYTDAEKTAAASLNREAARQKFSPDSGPLTYEFTKDPGYLHQYYRLREEMYISVWGLKHFDGQEDSFDADCHTLVARVGNHVVGGCRLIVVNPYSDNLLPLESEQFRLQNVLPGLNIESCKIAECSRLAVLPEYRMQVSRKLQILLTDHARDVGSSYAFAIAPAAQARSYKTYLRSRGYDFIITDVKVPEREEFEGIKMCLQMVDFHVAKQENNNLLEDAEAY